MPTEAGPAAERRALRLALAAALAVAVAYGLAFPLPFLAPLFVVFLSALPGPPLGPGKLLVLLLVMVLALAVGVLLIPLLRYYGLAAVLIVALAVYFAMYLSLLRGKRLLGTFLTIGVTMISVAGSQSPALATAIIASLALAMSTAVLCQWVVYPFLPDPGAVAAEPASPPSTSTWLALRATLIVMPAYLLALSNPQQYLMTIMKSVSLGQQASVVDARQAGRELLGSTFAGAILAVLAWCLLSLHPGLWMYILATAAVCLYGGCKLYRVLPTGVAPSFWVNALVTLFILLGPAVEDSANGKDALTASLVRFATFVGVTLYACVAIAALEVWRARREARRAACA